jgi:hypothetical protein
VCGYCWRITAAGKKSIGKSRRWRSGERVVGGQQRNGDATKLAALVVIAAVRMVQLSAVGLKVLRTSFGRYALAGANFGIETASLGARDATAAKRQQQNGGQTEHQKQRCASLTRQGVAKKAGAKAHKARIVNQIDPRQYSLTRIFCAVSRPSRHDSRYSLHYRGTFQSRKTNLVSHLMADNAHVLLSVSYTTRESRFGWPWKPDVSHHRPPVRDAGTPRSARPSGARLWWRFSMPRW